METQNEKIALREALISKYESMRKLDTGQLHALENLQRKSKWYRMSRYMGILLMMVIFSSASVALWNNYTAKVDMFEVLAIATLEHENYEDHIRVDNPNANFDYMRVKKEFAFMDIPSLQTHLTNAKIVQYNKCWLLDAVGVHLIVENMESGERKSVYQFPYNQAKSMIEELDTKNQSQAYRYNDNDMEVAISANKKILMVSTKIL